MYIKNASQNFWILNFSKVSRNPLALLAIEPWITFGMDPLMIIRHIQFDLDRFHSYIFPLFRFSEVATGCSSLNDILKCMHPRTISVDFFHDLKFIPLDIGIVLIWVEKLGVVAATTKRREQTYTNISEHVSIQ